MESSPAELKRVKAPNPSYFSNLTPPMDSLMIVSTIKYALAKLTKEIDSLKSNSCSRPSAALTNYSSATSSQISTSLPRSIPTTIHEGNERKSNLIITGLEESEPGTHIHKRYANDLASVTALLPSLDSIISYCSIRDCYRLGKFDNKRCSPILVKMNRPVSCILALRTKLANRTRHKIRSLST